MKAVRYIFLQSDIMRKYIIIFTAVICCFGLSAVAQTINTPSDLEAEFEDFNYVKVKWDDNSNNEDGFLVERALDSDSLAWEIVGQTQANIERFDDYWILFNRVYHYRVYAYNSVTTSSHSNTDTVYTNGDTTLIPAAPTNLRVIKTTVTSIRIQWDDNANNENGFIVARKRPELPYYEFIDSVASDVLTYQEVGLTPDNVYFYKVCAYNNFGISDYTNTVSARTEENTLIQLNTIASESFYMRDNYPNPFNPATNIEFGLSENADVRLEVYNSAGVRVDVLVNSRLNRGVYGNRWNASELPSGTYFYRLEARGDNGEIFTMTKKMILLK